MSFPSKRIVPAEGVSKPPIKRKAVVFPQPLGPRSEKNSPRWMLTLKGHSRKAPKSLETSISSNDMRHLIKEMGGGYKRIIEREDRKERREN